MFTEDQLKQLRQIVREEVAKAVRSPSDNLASEVEAVLGDAIRAAGVDLESPDCPPVILSPRFIRRAVYEHNSKGQNQIAAGAKEVRALARGGHFRQLPISPDPQKIQGDRAGVLVLCGKVGRCFVSNPNYRPKILQ